MALEEARAGLNRTSASPPPLPARAPFEPAPFKTPAPTLGPALESNLSLWQTCSEKRLLDHDNDRSACICCVAASNQHDLHLDPVPLEPSLGPNHELVRWLFWALERPRRMSCGLIWALNDSADGSGDGYDPVGVQAATVAAWNPLSEDEVSPGGWSMW